MGKKWITVLIAIGVSCLSAACVASPTGDENGFVISTDNGKTDEGSKDSVIDEEDKKTDDKNKETEEKDKTSELQNQPEKRVVVVPFSTNATIEETVLYEENNVRITALALTYSSYQAKLGVKIENNSDKNLSFSCGTAGYCCNAVNSYMVGNGYLVEDIAAGDSLEDELCFTIDMLQIYGIKEIAKIDIGFAIQDEAGNKVYTGPMTVKTSAFDNYDFSEDTYIMSLTSGAIETLNDCIIESYEEEELCSINEVKMISNAMMINKQGSRAVLLEIFNDSSDAVYAEIADVSVNHLVIYNFNWSSDYVNPGAKTIMDISMDSILKEGYAELLGINEIGEIGFTYRLCDKDGRDLAEIPDVKVTFPGKQNHFDSGGTELFHEAGIRMLYKGVTETKGFSDWMEVQLLVENTSENPISITSSIDALLEDDREYTYSCSSGDILPGKCVLVTVNVMPEEGVTKTMLKGNEVKLEIRDQAYELLGEPVIVLE